MRSFAYLAIFSCCLSLCGCDSETPRRNYDIYVLGYRIAPDGTKSVSYWKNGLEVPLMDGSTGAKITSMSVFGNIVYIGGSEPDATSNIEVAKYWENGKPVPLSDGTSNHIVTDMEMFGSNTYVVGVDLDNGIPKFWKKGIETILPHTDWASPAQLHVKHDEAIYIVGVDKSVDSIRGRFWLNGEMIRDYGKKAKHTEYSSIFAVEHATYIAGFDNADVKNGEGKVWINGLKTTLLSTARPGNIVIYNNEFYVVDVAGPGYWKDVHFKEVEKNTDDTSATGVVIAVADGDVVVATNKRQVSSGKHLGGHLWVNGVAEAPFNSDNNIEIIDVVVVNQ